MSNIVWTSWKEDCEIKEPFLAYVGRHALRRFGDFLYDSDQWEDMPSKYEEIAKSSRFGSFEPENLIDVALSSVRMKKNFEHEKDN